MKIPSTNHSLKTSNPNITIIMPKRLLYSCLKIRLIEKGNSALRYCQNLGIKAGVLLDQSK